MHQFARRHSKELPGPKRALAELPVLAHLDPWKLMRLPPAPQVTKRGAQRVRGRAPVEPPDALIRDKPHGVVAGDGLAGGFEPLHLVGEASRRGVIVIVPVRNDLAVGVPTAEIALAANVEAFLDM